MARKLASAVALALMVVSATVLALGLGNITTRSTLNQGLDAEVELLSVDPADLDGVRVSLASAEDFKRAGVDRPFFLTELEFTPMLNAAGKPVIHIHSRQPIREPFLDFLVEVNWPKGRLVREYTILLDPPTTLKRRPSPVAQPQMAPKTTAPAPAPAPAAVPAATAVMPDQYGPVQANETLWSISKKVRMDGASMAQTLMALYKANPKAFARGNINRLERGRILRLPARDEVFALSRSEAQAAYRAEQDAALAARTQPDAMPPESAGAGGVAATAPGEGAELRIATPRPEGKGEAGAGDETATQPTADDLKNALALAREDAESSRQTAENLRGKVDSMEQQMADMQRLLSLKDEQLARLQANVEETGTVAGTTEAPAAEEGKPAEVAEQAPAAAAAVTPAAEAQAPEAPQAPAAEPEAAPSPTPTVVSEPEPAHEQGLMDVLADNALLVGGGAGGVLLLLVLLLVMRRRAKGGETATSETEEPLEESILLEPGEGEDFDLSAVEEAAPAGNDTSFLSEFSASEMHSLAEDTSEVDPVSEADVYIAYGRYDQAEELLSQALNREPQRLALKFKLLEVYYANHNVSAFTACAQELADAGQDGVDKEGWARVCDMGRELAPDYPLFSKVAPTGAEESQPNFEPSEPVGLDTLSDFNEESILEIPGEGEQQGGRIDAMSEQAPETDMDLTLDLDDLSMPQSVAQDDESLEGLESIDLELPDLDKDPGRKAAPADVSDDSLVLDLDTGFGDSGLAGGQAATEKLDAESLQAQLEELSDLTDLDEELSQLTAEFDSTAQPAIPDVVEEIPAEELASELSQLEIPAPYTGQMPDEDEVQTKLDLAIAYVEMGDKEGARSILDEVCAEGSDEQKAQAEKLLADISA